MEILPNKPVVMAERAMGEPPDRQIAWDQALDGTGVETSLPTELSAIPNILRSGLTDRSTVEIGAVIVFLTLGRAPVAPRGPP
jgi:hypothetical protein